MKPQGRYRAVVYETGLSRTTEHWFDDLDRAKAYANDCASETEHGPVFACVYENETEVYRGRHYGLPE